MSRPMTGCPSAQELELFITEQLPPDSVELIDTHVSTCAFCRDELERLNCMPGLVAFAAELSQNEISSSQPRVPEIEGYQELQAVGDGGMGLIYSARHQQLSRVLALKVLHPKLMGVPEFAERFVQEARINAGLQHPSIVPVHEIGLTRDKRPYFSMKLIVGETFQSRLSRRQSALQDVPEMLRIFELICQGVAAAHEQGVIHRDLKPENVMVGKFGEVQVMDWGIAKSIDKKDDHNSEHTLTVSDEIRTILTRGALGTYSYMPPEQAMAETNLQDQRSDVFSLGAILCQILTGEPPYCGDKSEVKLQAEGADLTSAFTRLEGCGADAALVSLTRACLAKDRAGRPASAIQLADAITRFRQATEQRLKEAEAAKAAAIIKGEEERKRWRLSAVLVGCLIVFGLLASAGIWWKQNIEALQKAELLAALQQAETSLDFENWSVAEPNMRRASEAEVLRLMPEEATRAAEARQQLNFGLQLDRLTELRLRLLEDKDGPDVYFTHVKMAFQDIGVDILDGDLQSTGDRLRNLRIQNAAVALLDECVGLLELTHPTTRRIAALAERADNRQGPWFAAARNPDNWVDREKLSVVLDEAPWSEMSPSLALLLTQRWQKLKGDPTTYLRKAQVAHPDDFWLNTMLGQSLSTASPGKDMPPQLAYEMVGFFRVALAVRKNSPAAQTNLGLALSSAGQFQEANELLTAAAKQLPDHYRVHLNLGILLMRQGKPDEARKEFVISLSKNDKLSVTHYQLGVALKALGHLNEAEAAYQKSIELDGEHWDVHFAMGNVHVAKRQWQQAADAYENAIRIDRSQPDVYKNLSYVRRRLGDLDAAIAAGLRAVELKPERGSYIILAGAYHERGNTEEAAKYIRLAELQGAK